MKCFEKNKPRVNSIILPTIKQSYYSYCGANAVIRWLLGFNKQLHQYDSSSNLTPLKPDDHLQNSHELTGMLYLYNQNEFYNDTPMVSNNL